MKFNWNATKFKRFWLPRLKSQVNSGILSSEQDAIDAIDNAVYMLDQINKTKPFEIDYDQEMDSPISLVFENGIYADVYYFDTNELNLNSGIGVSFEGKELYLNKFLRELRQVTASTNEKSIKTKLNKLLKKFNDPKFDSDIDLVIKALNKAGFSVSKVNISSTKEGISLFIDRGDQITIFPKGVSPYGDVYHYNLEAGEPGSDDFYKNIQQFIKSPALSKRKGKTMANVNSKMKLSYDSLYEGILSIIALHTTSTKVSNKCGEDSFIEWCEDNNKVPHLKQFMKSIKDKNGFWKDLETSGLDFSENPRLKEQIKSLLGITTASTKGKTMKYSKALDHLLVAVASLQEGNAEEAEDALQEALESEDLDETLADLTEMQEEALADETADTEVEDIVEEALSEEEGVEVAKLGNRLTFTMAGVRNARQAKQVFKSLASVDDVEELTEDEMDDLDLDAEEAVKATIDGEEVVVSFDEDGEGEVVSVEYDEETEEAKARNKKRRTMANDLTDDDDDWEDDNDWDEEPPAVTASRKCAYTTAGTSRVKRVLAGLNLQRIARNRRSL